MDAHFGRTTIQGDETDVAPLASVNRSDRLTFSHITMLMCEIEGKIDCQYSPFAHEPATQPLDLGGGFSPDSHLPPTDDFWVHPDYDTAYLLDYFIRQQVHKYCRQASDDVLMHV